MKKQVENMEFTTCHGEELQLKQESATKLIAD